MVAYLRQKRIAPYKLPERLEIVETFPMAGDGQKVDKRTLTQYVARKLKDEGKI
jgi:non-ribosomal peptide synthetase component E (peptide arylation enzyme)